ncbi:olfactory receptor 1D2-like [Syngnathoides biaculeatus]|uniref:olfactory receptor 1D2-like n=1 Tax=Syngnathoides biaculeatus TaxID=300417 RepID=UPI002ADE7610|nr:olfactory receptor 1D2-like [Syngnathoides biaculeatus]
MPSFSVSGLSMRNASALTFFHLTGLSHMTPRLRVLVFAVTLLCYAAILLVNGLLIVTIVLEKKLHEPMYYFVCNLCVNGLYGTVAFFPKFLYDLLSESHVVSYVGCLLQVFVIYSYAASEIANLAVMAYDRYVAITRPLEYHAVMTKRRALMLVSFSRVVPMLCQAVVTGMTSRLELCGSHIGKLYCENWSLLQLSCEPVTINSVVGFANIVFYFGHDLFIMCSYVQLVKIAFRSKDGKKKFTQTCVPHLLSLFNISVALLFDLMYARYGTSSVPRSLRNFMAIQILAFPPLLNPVIYGMKLSKIRGRILQYFTRKRAFELR